MLFGRVTYDSFAGAWPGRELAGEADADMARALGNARKIVVPRQHLEFTWRNSQQLDGDLAEAVAALKQEPGEGTIGMSGSVSLVRQLPAPGLIDELHLLVHPIALRKGMRLFRNNRMPLRKAMGRAGGIISSMRSAGKKLADDGNGPAHADRPLARLLLECGDCLGEGSSYLRFSARWKLQVLSGDDDWASVALSLGHVRVRFSRRAHAVATRQRSYAYVTQPKSAGVGADLWRRRRRRTHH